MKTDFTETEKSVIQSICSLYGIQTLLYKDGVFKGLIHKKARITLNGEYFLQLLNTDNAVYFEMQHGINLLIIVAQ